MTLMQDRWRGTVSATVDSIDKKRRRFWDARTPLTQDAVLFPLALPPLNIWVTGALMEPWTWQSLSRRKIMRVTKGADRARLRWASGDKT